MADVFKNGTDIFDICDAMRYCRENQLEETVDAKDLERVMER